MLDCGYTCDNCGGELFDYPNQRVCRRCEESFLKPTKACPKCGRERVAEGICLTCKSRGLHFTQALSPFVYKSEAAVSINRVKNGDSYLAAYFGERMAEKFLSVLGSEWDSLLIIPVPLTKKRLRERGYNQAERLAEGVQAYLNRAGISVETDFSILEKKRETVAQKDVMGKEREENVKGAYHLHKRAVCKGRTVLLVDDIMTTGSTGSECARLILNAGAEKVFFLTATALPEQK